MYVGTKTDGKMLAVVYYSMQGKLQKCEGPMLSCTNITKTVPQISKTMMHKLANEEGLLYNHN
jgi:hypothetical protein